jgi:hypothetical protein
MTEGKKMYRESKENGFALGACEPVSENSLSEKPLLDRAEEIEIKANRLFELAELIHGELYGHHPVNGECCDGNKPRHSLDEYISKTRFTLGQIEDCLVDTLRRLRG